MTKTHALDSILPVTGPTLTQDGETLSLASRIIAGERGVLVELHRTDVVSGQSATELVRLNATGERSASLVLTQEPDPSERRIAEALTENAAGGLVLVPGGAVPLCQDLQPLAKTVSTLNPAYGSQIVLAEGWCVLCDPANGALTILNTDTPSRATALETPKLNLGGWRALTGVAVFGGLLFAAVADPVAGFDLYSYDLTSRSAEFEPILTRGAQRFALNGAVASMARCDQGLLLGTAALAGPAEPVGDWGPELLLVTTNGKWDLIAGQPRFSPDGLMLPASTRMPGMGLPDNAAVKAMAHREGQTVIAIQEFTGDTVADRREVRANLFDYQGAVRLYRSSDLGDWEEIEHNLPDDMGALTSLCLAGDGLFVGHEGLGPDTVPVRFVALR